MPSLSTSLRSLLCAAVLAAPLLAAGQAKPTAKAISPDLFGIFFEDINYAADGGLYGELVQNRSFEYAPSDHEGWHPLSGWDYLHEGYAVGTSPFGPFQRVGKIMAQDPNVGTGAGHHSVVNVPGTDRWYIVYHRHPLGDKDGNHRQVCIEEMHFDAKGQILPVKLTTEGVAAQPLR